MRIDTWINNELSTVETDDVFGQTFAHWDCLVSTEQATAIAAATVAILEGRSLTPPRKPRAVPVAPAVESMTDAQLFAHYRKTVHIEDLKFFLRFRMSAALRARAEAITKPTKLDLILLRDAWGSERLAEEKASGIEPFSVPATVFEDEPATVAA